MAWMSASPCWERVFLRNIWLRNGTGILIASPDSSAGVLKVTVSPQKGIGRMK